MEGDGSPAHPSGLVGLWHTGIMPESLLAVRVDCYAGHRGEETPRRFCLGDRWIEVVELVDQWLAPDHRYFKVTGDDRGTYILRHDAA